jgi:hypothetical protein
MKKLLLFLLFPLAVHAQTTFIGSNGSILRCSTIATFTNTVTTDQALFSSTIKANTMTVDRPYALTCDLAITSSVLTLPNISFDVKLGSNTLTFVSASTLTASVTAANITITGYLVLRPDGTVFVKFAPSPTGTAMTPISLTLANTSMQTVWSGVNTTIDNAFSVNVAFSSTTTSTTITRNYYARSEF